MQVRVRSVTPPPHVTGHWSQGSQGFHSPLTKEKKRGVQIDYLSLLNLTEEGEELSFKIKCNGKKMSNGVKSSMSYEIKGNTNDKKTFLKNIEKLRKAAIKYYKSKE